MLSALGVRQLEPQMLQRIGFFGTKAVLEPLVLTAVPPFEAPW